MQRDAMRKDILKELINVYVGRAANTLSNIIKKKVGLTVPQIHVFDPVVPDHMNPDDLPQCMKAALMLSRIKFEKELEGFAELIFPLKHIKQITAICLDMEEVDFSLQNQEIMDFSDIDFDVIKELGNVVLNAVIGGLGDFLGMRIDYSLPEVSIFDKIEIYSKPFLDENMHVLILYVTFQIDTTEIEGAMILNFTMNSMKELFLRLDQLKEQLGE